MIYDIKLVVLHSGPRRMKLKGGGWGGGRKGRISSILLERLRVTQQGTVIRTLQALTGVKHANIDRVHSTLECTDKFLLPWSNTLLSGSGLEDISGTSAFSPSSFKCSPLPTYFPNSRLSWGQLRWILEQDNFYLFHIAMCQPCAQLQHVSGLLYIHRARGAICLALRDWQYGK